MNSFDSIKLENFEGPLDLLLTMIEKRKLQINTISLSNIADEYIKRIKDLTEYPTEEITKFIYIASILILIKSKSLLPILEYTNVEESEMETLEERLKLYKYIKDNLNPKLTLWGFYSSSIRGMSLKKEIKFTPVNVPTKDDIFKSAHSALESLSFIDEKPKKTVGKLVSIEEMINRILKQIEEQVSLSFNKIADIEKKRDFIVSFLAILELYKNNLLLLKQERDFDDIMIEKYVEKT